MTAAYDNLGRITSISTMPTAVTVDAVYDALSRPLSQASSDIDAMAYQ